MAKIIKIRKSESDEELRLRILKEELEKAKLLDKHLNDAKNKLEDRG